jgi:hypothetical protein
MLTNRRTFIGALLWLVPLVASGQDNRQPVPLIFDTDMMGDVDDVGTAAVLHALADQGEAKILAMGVYGTGMANRLSDCLSMKRSWVTGFGCPMQPRERSWSCGWTRLRDA